MAAAAAMVAVVEAELAVVVVVVMVVAAQYAPFCDNNNNSNNYISNNNKFISIHKNLHLLSQLPRLAQSIYFTLLYPMYPFTLFSQSTSVNSFYLNYH